MFCPFCPGVCPDLVLRAMGKKFARLNGQKSIKTFSVINFYITKPSSP